MVLKFKSKTHKIEKPKELIELEARYNEIVNETKKAKSDLESATHYFNHVEPVYMNENNSYIDIAILNKEAAERRYSLLIKESKILYQEIQQFAYNA